MKEYKETNLYLRELERTQQAQTEATVRGTSIAPAVNASASTRVTFTQQRQSPPQLSPQLQPSMNCSLPRNHGGAAFMPFQVPVAPTATSAAATSSVTLSQQQQQVDPASLANLGTVLQMLEALGCASQEVLQQLVLQAQQQQPPLLMQSPSIPASMSVTNAVSSRFSQNNNAAVHSNILQDWLKEQLLAMTAQHPSNNMQAPTVTISTEGILALAQNNGSLPQLVSAIQQAPAERGILLSNSNTTNTASPMLSYTSAPPADEQHVASNTTAIQDLMRHLSQDGQVLLMQALLGSLSC